MALICPDCGRSQPDDVTTCDCGYDLQALPRQSPPPRQKTPRPDWITGAAIVVLWLAAGIRGVWGVYTAISLWSAGSGLRGVLELVITAAVVVVAIGLATTMSTVGRVSRELTDVWWSLRQTRRDDRRA